MQDSNSKRLIIGILSVIFLSCPYLQGKAMCETGQDIIQVPAMGSAPIGKSDTMTVRSEAVKKALAKSVESALFRILPPESLASDFKTIESVLSADPTQFVRDYKVLGEETAGKEYRVIINANVISAKLSSAARPNGPDPEETAAKVLVLVSERLDPSGQPIAWWAGNGSEASLCEQEIVSVLASKKIGAVDHSAPAMDDKGKAIALSPIPTDQEALALARAYKADLVILGSVSCQDSGNTISGGLKSFPARAEARLISVSNGTEIASAAETASALNAESLAGTRQAATQAIKQVSAKLAQAASTSWKKPAASADSSAQTGLNTIPVTINGQDILGKMIPIRTAMTSIKGVKEVKTLEMNFSNAKLQANYEGDPSTLVKELALKSFENFRMEIVPDPEKGIIINIPDQKVQ